MYTYLQKCAGPNITGEHACLAQKLSLPGSAHAHCRLYYVTQQLTSLQNYAEPPCGVQSFPLLYRYLPNVCHRKCEILFSESNLELF